MTTTTDPVIGNWYKDVENNLTFKVVAIDEDDESVEVQYNNGDISEFDLESWYSSTFDYIEDPEDWTAPYGQLEADDMGYSDPDTHFNPNEGDMNLSGFTDK